MTPAPGMPLPVTFCAWEECKRVFRPGRTDQECCTVTCEKRRKRALHPSTKPSRATAPVKHCKARGCTLRVRTEADFCSEHNGSRHGRAPVVVGRVETVAATATVCPDCGGPVKHDGPLAYCLDRDEADPEACGWVELVRRVVRAGEGRGVRA